MPRLLLLLVFLQCVSRAFAQGHVLSAPRANLAAATLSNFAIFAGGTFSSGVTGAIDIYDASTDTWNSTAQGAGALSPARYAMGATAVGFYIMFGGGFTGAVLSGQVDAFDVRDSKWYAQSLSVPRDYIAAVSYGNQAFFAGGYASSGASNVIDVFSGTNLAPLPSLTLPSPRAAAAVATVGSKIVFSGGDTAQLAYSATADVYDVSANSWITTGPRSVAAVAAIALAVDSSRIMFAGGLGIGGVPVANVDFYDVMTNIWTPSTTALSVARNDGAGLIVGSKLVIAGGYNPNSGSNFGCQDTVDVYDIPSNTWQSSETNASVGKLLPARTALAAVSINGLHMFAGGGNCNSVYINTINYFPFPTPQPPTTTPPPPADTSSAPTSQPPTTAPPTSAPPADTSSPPTSQPPTTSPPASQSPLTKVPVILLQQAPVVIYGDAIADSNVTAFASGASLTPMLTVTGTLTISDGVQLTLQLNKSAPADSSVAIVNSSLVTGQFSVLHVLTPKSEITCARIQGQATSISVILPSCNNRRRFPIYLIVLIVIGVVAFTTVAVFFVARWCLPRRSLEGAIYDGDNTYNRLS